MSRFIRAFAPSVAALSIALPALLTTAATAQTAAPGQPVLQGSYGWDDGEATILGSNSTSITAVNIDDFVHSGTNALQVTTHTSSVVHVYLGHIRNLEHGDIIRASFWTHDDVLGTTPRVRIWGHYTIGDSIEPAAQAGGNLTYSQGIGWEELSHEWTFNAFTGAGCNGDCDGFVIQARFYMPSGCTENCADFFVDNLNVKVYCAADPDLTLSFPDGTTVDEPLLPGDPCTPIDEPLECDLDLITNDYGWEDGKATTLGGQSLANVTVENTTEFALTGTHSLKAVEDGHTSSARILYLAHVNNLTDGDVVSAGFWGYDDTPGAGTSENPAGSYRIWARYTSGTGIAGLTAFPPGLNNESFSTGIGWEEMKHSWVFDSSLGDGIVIEARLYGSPATCPECSMTYYIDDMWVDVCTANPQDIVISLPEDGAPDPGEPDPGDPPPTCDRPVLTATYGWEDGAGTVVGNSNASIITTANVTDFVHTGSNALRITESPHHPTQNPQIWLAHVRNLADGDIVSAKFWAYDDTPDAAPSVRIWSHYTSGTSPSSSGAILAGQQNLAFSSGIGWEEMGHAWEFNSNNGQHDGMVIRVHIYSPTCPPEEVCSTDFYIDDLTISVCTDDAKNILIAFPDVFVVEPEPPIEMCNDPMVGTFGWNDGKSTIIGASSSAIEAFNVSDLVFSGDNALKVVETGHVGGNREVYLALVENLQPGDTVRAGFMVHDDVPGVPPRVRIWGRYAVSGDPLLKTAAGGNETYSSGIGWEPLEHTWLFNPPDAEIPRNALMIVARVYSANCPEEEQPCIAEYHFDDMFVEACGDHPNLTITFSDGDIIGDPGEPQDCVADVDGSGEIDIFDVFAVLGAWNTTDAAADVNGDGFVDGADLGITLASLGPCEDFLHPMRGSGQLILQETPLGSETQIDLYVQLDPDEALVNVYDADVTSSLGFNSGSFITIGDTQPNFDIAEDPNFDFFAFMSGTHLGADAGWYNFNPDNNLGLAGLYPNNRVLIGRFFVDEASEFDAVLWVSYRDGDGRARQVGLTLDPPTTPCPADISSGSATGVPDGVVDIFDLLFVLANWGSCANPADCPADISSGSATGVPDGVVDIFDLLFILANWGSCP